jgi:hypothetical protein
MGVRDFFRPHSGPPRGKETKTITITLTKTEKEKSELLFQKHAIKVQWRALDKKTPAYETRLLRLFYPIRSRTQLYTLLRLQL